MVAMKECAEPHCENSYESHYWGTLKAHQKGWFNQKDGTSWCPDHVPEWVASWRARQKLEQADFETGLEQMDIKVHPKQDQQNDIGRYDTCPLIGQDHGRHYFPHVKGGSMHCIGWHAINRDIVRNRARFHSDYLRGKKSNLIHRSTHEGEITWFPEDAYQYGGEWKLTFWKVKPVCSLPELVNPDLLDAQGVEQAEDYEVHHSVRHKVVTLCQKCFPGADQRGLHYGKA